MPDPKTLKVGDRVRFVAIPDEWSDPKAYVPEDSRAFMEVLIERRFPSRIWQVDEFGQPWIAARIKVGDKYEEHTWAIVEETGWRKVVPRSDRNK